MKIDRVRRLLSINLILLLFLSAIQVMPFKAPFIDLASGGSSWVQTTESDFKSGTSDNVTITSEGNVTLDVEAKYVEDDFKDETKIDYKKNVKIDRGRGQANLIQYNNKPPTIEINKTFGGSLFDTGRSIKQTTDGGYIIAGYTDSYGAGNWDASLIKTDLSGNETWNKTFGGSDRDHGYSVQQTSNGGYVITGDTWSYGAGIADVWLIKTDSSGNETWNKTFGGSSIDEGRSAMQTTDGGFILVGETQSYGAGGIDAWLIKTDSSGNEQWNKTFGGSASDYGLSAQQTPDGGYILTGQTQSYGSGSTDVWLIKTDSAGNETWNKTFGGSASEYALSVLQTSDVGYILACYTQSYGAGSFDIWLIKTDLSGNEQWNKTIGGSLRDQCYSIQQTGDGGYIVAGYTKSYGVGNADVWLIKVDSLGNETWNKTFGGSSIDIGYSVRQTTDGGFIIVGETQSYGAGNTDIWLIKTSGTCGEQWNRTFGGGSNDQGLSMKPTSNGYFVITGYTKSYGSGAEDVWLIKTNLTGLEQWNKSFGGSNDDKGWAVDNCSDDGYIIVCETRSYGAGKTDVWLIRTNETGVEQWNKTFGGRERDYGKSVEQTSDGGYIITGGCQSFGHGFEDMWLIKTNDKGTEQWNRTFGGGPGDVGYSVQQTTDSGYIIAGFTNSFGNGTPWNTNVWIVKTDSSGNEQWNKTFEGGDFNQGWSVQQTSDGGYIISARHWDGLWLIKTSSEGSEQWNKTYGVYDLLTFEAKQTADNGYIIAYNTYTSIERGYDSYLMKTNETGAKQWEKCFGGNKNDYGQSIYQTTDGSYVVAGYTYSYGNGGSDVWLYKYNPADSKYFTSGEMISTNFLEDIEIYSLDTFNYNAVVPSGTDIKVQFSQDKINWYNSSGDQNGWNILSNGHNSIDLDKLDWDRSLFYYRMNFTSDNITSPALQNIRLSFKQYFSQGTYESPAFDSGGDTQWGAILWNATIESGTDIRFQLRTSNTQGGLSSKNFVGFDGTQTTFYTVSGTGIWSGHDNEQWIQYKAYLSTDNQCISTILEDVTLTYSSFGKINELLQKAPLNNSLINDSKPIFSWDYYGSGSNITSAFRLVIDDDPDFSSIEYDSGIQNSLNSSWQFTIQVADGYWYWKVKVRNQTGTWVGYDHYWNLTIDTTPPESFTPTAKPNGWTRNKQPLIYFSTIDTLSGVDHYEVSVDNNNFSNQSSPYTLPLLSDGSHNITVRAYDKAGNYRDGYTVAAIDTTPPENLKSKASPGTWTNAQPIITFSADDYLSGMSRYEVAIDGAEFTNLTSPYQIPPQSSGIHNITVRAYDLVENFMDGYVDVYIDIDPPDNFTVSADPSGWTSTNMPVISFTAADRHSGMDHFKVKIDIGSFSTQTGLYTIPPQTDGPHNITVRAFDNVGNYLDRYANVYIDTVEPKPFPVMAEPGNWTNSTRPVISFSTTDATSGVDHYEVRIGRGSFSIQTSPYILPAQSDGTHTITVRAYDRADNYQESSTNIYIDTVQPDSFTPAADPGTWTADTRPQISFSTTDATSGIDHYEVRIGGGSFSTQISPYYLLPLDDGVHDVTVRAYDRAGNYIDGYVSVYIDTAPPESFIPASKPDGWTSNTQPQITFATTDITSGVDRYVVKIDGGTAYPQTSPYKLPPLDDGVHEVTVRAYDRAGNYIEGNVNVYIDSTPPEDLTVEINSGAAITNSTVVKLKLEASDATSGLHQMSFGNDGQVWCEWEDYAVSKSYVFTSGDGIKTIYFRVNDRAGNIAKFITASIKLNTEEKKINPDNATDQNQTEPFKTDSDGDGYNDDIDAFPNDPDEYIDSDDDNIGNGMDPDDDNDGLPDKIEQRLGTDPLSKDTDNDGYEDGDDTHPLDPERWEKKSKAPEDADTSWGIIAGIIMVIIAIIIVLFMFILKPLVLDKKKDETSEETPEEEMVDEEPEDQTETEI